MYAEYYAFGGVLFCIEAEEKLARSVFTAPFALEAPGRAADFTAKAVFTARDIPDGAELRLRNDRSAEVCFAARYRSEVSAKHVLEYIRIFSVLAGHGGIVLHASYVLTRQGDAILFAAPSGTGKSTQAALWSRHAAARLINGDRTLVTVQNGKVRANGIFFCGTSAICENATAPIRAIVLLRQQESNELRPASGKEAFMRLLPQCSYYPEERESVRAATGILAEIISAVPIYDFGCVREESAVKTLSEVLYGNHAY